jgi:hypothetical protein
MPGDFLLYAKRPPQELGAALVARPGASLGGVYLELVLGLGINFSPYYTTKAPYMQKKPPPWLGSQ